MLLYKKIFDWGLRPQTPIKLNPTNQVSSKKLVCI